MRRTHCRVESCAEPLFFCSSWFGLCPSCQTAALLGFKSATTILTALGGVLAFIAWVSK